MSAVESYAELAERLAVERQPLLAVPEGLRVAITGGRDHIPDRAEISAFWRIWDRLGAAELHHGDARGVDRYMAAVVRGERPAVKIVAHPARWDDYGRRAGFLRNEEMLTRVQALIAFPGGRGTAHCTSSARQRGLPVHSVQDEVRMEIERELIDPGLWT